MTLLKDEVKLDSLTNSVLLTNYRILKEHGDKYKISIFLEKISSIEMHYKSKILYLILGIIACIAGLIMQGEGAEAGLPLLVVGIVLVIAFFLTRKHVITVSPDGGKSLDIEVKGISSERVEEFLTNVQEAKLNKVREIHNS